MANDRWDDDDVYRARRYGYDPDYERAWWRDRDARHSQRSGEQPRERYSSLPVFGVDHGGTRRWLGGRGGPERWEEDRSDTRERYLRGYGDNWNRGDEYRRGSHERNWWDRTKDEVRSWMGDQEAEHRREADHRGRGPRGYTRTDERIREDVSDQLMEDPYVDATDIEVLVVAGEVTLSGTIDDRNARRRAENIVADVLGVKDVQNNLRIRARTTSGTMTEDWNERSGRSTTRQGETAGTTTSSTPRH